MLRNDESHLKYFCFRKSPPSSGKIGDSAPWVQKTPDIWQIIGNAATFSCLQRMTLIDGRGERISIEESLLP
jgi:hypothetical protein